MNAEEEEAADQYLEEGLALGRDMIDTQLTRALG